MNAAARGVVAPFVTSVRSVHTFCPVHPVRLAADAGGPINGLKNSRPRITKIRQPVAESVPRIMNPKEEFAHVTDFLDRLYGTDKPSVTLYRGIAWFP